VYRTAQKKFSACSVHPNSEYVQCAKIQWIFFVLFDTHEFQWKFQWICLWRKNPADLKKYSAGLCTDPYRLEYLQIVAILNILNLEMSSATFKTTFGTQSSKLDPRN
jgi:hypothetical protein